MDSVIYKLYSNDNISNSCLYYAGNNYIVSCDNSKLKVFQVNNEKTKINKLAEYVVSRFSWLW